MKVFVNNADGYFENVLCEILNTKRNYLFGTRSSQGTELDAGCPQYLSRTVSKDSNDIKKALLEADVIVYRLTDSIEEVKYAIKLLESAQYNTRKVFILISSVISWVRTKKVYIEEEEEEVEEEGEEKEESMEAEENDEEAEHKGEHYENAEETSAEVTQEISQSGEDNTVQHALTKRKNYEPLTEDMVTSRRPHANYKEVLEIEKRVRRANCSTLKTFVLFSGLMYGRGEDMLHQFFKSAWMGEPHSLLCPFDGGNYLPLIHVEDLVRITERIIIGSFPEEEEEPEEFEQYMLANDSSTHTLKEIIEALGKRFHSSEIVTHVFDERDVTNKFEHLDYITMDLKFDMDASYVSQMDIEWKCKEGLIYHLKTVRFEYETKRKLTPLKVAILGPPSSGKSIAAKELSLHYKIPHLKIDDIIREFLEREQDWEKQLFELDSERIMKEKEYEKQVRERENMIKEKLFQRETRMQERLNEIKKQREQENMTNKQDDEEEEGESEEEREHAEEEDEHEDDDEEILDRIREEMGEFDEEEEGIPPEPEPLEEEELEPQDPKAILRRKISKSKKITSLRDEIGRFTDKALTAMVKFKLSQRICRNQGWILDGYPKTVVQTKMLMLSKYTEEREESEENEDEESEDIEEEEEAEEEDQHEEDGDEESEEDERAKGSIASEIFIPEYVVSLVVEPQVLEQRLNGVEPTVIERVKRRSIDYEKHNSGENTVVGCLNGLITRSKAQPIIRDIVVTQEHMIQDLKRQAIDFIGEPRNYGPSKEELEAIAFAEQERIRLEEERKERERIEFIERQRREIEERQRVKERDLQRLEDIKQQEREMLDVKSLPLRHFLIESIIPVLTKGLVEIVQVKPEDPIDYLAEFLFRTADEQSEEEKRRN